MKTKKTHKERILNHLQTIGPITPWRALKDYGNTRLSATIFDIKKDIKEGKLQGFNIKTEMVEGTNRFGDKIRYALYTLIKE